MRLPDFSRPARRGQGGNTRALAHGTSALSRALAAGACIALVAGCSQPPPPPAAPDFVRRGQELRIPADSPLRQRIEIAPDALRQAPHFLAVPAVVTADPAHVARVFPAQAGRITALDVDLGERVTRGQPLARIASGGMAQAYAAVATARDTLALARSTLTRVRAVEQGGGAARKDLEAAQSAYREAAAGYQQAVAALEALGGAAGVASPKPIEVRAPIAGTVTALSIAPGTFVNDPTASMLTITDIDAVWVSAEVPGDDLRLVRTGQRAEINVPAYPDRTFTGVVHSIGAILDPNTRRVSVRIAVANRGQLLKPNMFATARLAVRQPPEVFVPVSALLMNNDATTVFVEVRPWTFVRRAVTVGYNEGADVRVLAGLKAGERIIVAGGVLLNDD